MQEGAPDRRVSVVMITRNRRIRAQAALRRLLALAERPAILVVDNGSTDGTLEALAGIDPRVQAIAAGANLGAAGRNIGAVHATTPYVAFSDPPSRPRATPCAPPSMTEPCAAASPTRCAERAGCSRTACRSRATSNARCAARSAPRRTTQEPRAPPLL
jgi:hypothetical protein